MKRTLMVEAAHPIRGGCLTFTAVVEVDPSGSCSFKYFDRRGSFGAGTFDLATPPEDKVDLDLWHATKARVAA